MKTVGELLFEREHAQAIRRAVQAEPPAPEPPAAAPTESVDLDSARAEGRRLFAAFDAQQKRIIQAEIAMGDGRPNREERARLAIIVRAIRKWIPEAQQLGLLEEIKAELRAFLAYLQHETHEQTLAAKVEVPLRTRLFVESGVDIAAPTAKPVENLCYDPDRCLHPRY